MNPSWNTQDLVPGSGIELRSSALGARSLSHLTAREAPRSAEDQWGLVTRDALVQSGAVSEGEAWWKVHAHDFALNHYPDCLDQRPARPPFGRGSLKCACALRSSSACDLQSQGGQPCAPVDSGLCEFCLVPAASPGAVAHCSARAVSLNTNHEPPQGKGSPIPPSTFPDPGRICFVAFLCW